VKTEIFLDIYNNITKVLSDSKETLVRLSKDFLSFRTKEQNNIDFLITVKKSSPPYHLLESQRSITQSQVAITYEIKGIRYNDYFGKALCIYDYEKNEGVIYSEDINLLHEISYLLILSRVGKKMDLNGYHKVHAFGLNLNNTSIIGMMPMKGGKSTLFLDLLYSDKRFEIISDDTPIIDSWGRVRSFPLRIGLESNAEIPVGDENLIYSLDRSQYGLKKLLPLNYFPNKIFQGCGKDIILLNCKRSYGSHFSISKASKVSMIVPLVKNMVIGVGLPMVLEYFLESGPKDLLKRVGIILRRTMAALFLLMRARTYHVYLGNDRKLNRLEMNAFFKKYCCKGALPKNYILGHD